MTYSDFLDLISNGTQLFYDTLITISNYLITNWFFITILGISIFVIFFYWFFDNFIDAPLKVKDNVDYWIDTKRNYKLYNDVKLNFMDTCPKDVYMYKMKNLVSSKNVQIDYLKNYEGFEYLIKSMNMKLGREVSCDSLSVNKDLEYKLKLKDFVLRKQVISDFEGKSVPDWFEKDIKKKEMTKQEKEEVDNILETF